MLAILIQQWSPHKQLGTTWVIHILFFVCWKWASLEFQRIWRCMERKKIWVFIGHSAPFCFLDQSSPEGLAEVVLCLSSLTPGLTQGPTCWLGIEVVRRERHGLAALSVLPGVVPTGPRVSFNRWEQIFRLPILYLTTTQAIPSTCNGKASLHFPTLCWILPNPGVQNMRNADHSQLQALGINNITSAEYIIQSFSKQRIWFYFIRLVYRSTGTTTFYTCGREQLLLLLPYD